MVGGVAAGMRMVGADADAVNIAATRAAAESGGRRCADACGGPGRRDALTSSDRRWSRFAGPADPRFYADVYKLLEKSKLFSATVT